MSARSKATGAAVLAVAPEAELAGAGAAGKAAKGRKAPVPDPRQTRPGSKAAQQRQQIEDLKARRKPSDEGGKPDTDDDEDQADDDAGGGRFAPFAGMQAPATGGGFALGLIVWALVRAYLGNPATGQPGGPAGVKALLNAKLFNKVTTGGAK